MHFLFPGTSMTKSLPPADKIPTLFTHMDSGLWVTGKSNINLQQPGLGRRALFKSENSYYSFIHPLNSQLYYSSTQQIFHNCLLWSRHCSKCWVWMRSFLSYSRDSCEVRHRKCTALTSMCELCVSREVSHSGCPPGARGLGLGQTHAKMIT